MRFTKSSTDSNETPHAADADRIYFHSCIARLEHSCEATGRRVVENQRARQVHIVAYSLLEQISQLDGPQRIQPRLHEWHIRIGITTGSAANHAKDLVYTYT